MVDELDEYDEQQMDDNFKKFQLWQQKKMLKASHARQGQIEGDALKEISEEFGITIPELQKQIGTVNSQDEQEETEREYKERVKGFYRARLGMKGKKEPGNPLQDSRGRFTSKAKMESERAYAQKIAEMKERVSKGGRLSEDELLEIMPRLR